MSSCNNGTICIYICFQMPEHIVLELSVFRAWKTRSSRPNFRVGTQNQFWSTKWPIKWEVRYFNKLVCLGLPWTLRVQSLSVWTCKWQVKINLFCQNILKVHCSWEWVVGTSMSHNSKSICSKTKITDYTLLLLWLVYI